MAEYEVLELGPFPLACGITLPSAQLAYKTYGTLSPAKDNLVLYPTSYAAHHSDIDWLIGPERVLDPTRWFIVIPNQLGNGLSTSPSTLGDPFGPGGAPPFSHLDNLAAQERLLDEVFGVETIALAYGWSMGGQQALHWGALRPERVQRICAVCTAARTSDYNKVFLSSLKATLTSDPAYRDGVFVDRPTRSLRAFARIYATMALSQDFYRDRLWAGLGFSSLEDFLVRSWEASFLHRDPANLLSMIDTWAASDIAANATFGGDLDAALRAIRAPTMIMPSTTDFYFTATDAEAEAAKMPGARFRPIESQWGHRAGNPVQNPADEAVLRAAVAELTATL
jgi:homoserine O-acetyltransferase